MANRRLLESLVAAGVMSAGEAMRAADYVAVPRAKNYGRSFQSAQSSNLTYSWANNPVPIDSDIRRSLRRLRARSRHEAQNNDHMRRFLALLKNNVVGHKGIILQARITDPGGGQDRMANNTIETGWAKWGEKGTPEVTGRYSWVSACRQYIETVGRDGEVLVRKLFGWRGNKYRYAFQFLDVELLDVEHNRKMRNGNTIQMGVELDQYRRPVAYHLLTTKVGADTYPHNGRRYERIPAEEIIHEFLPEWVWQSRGIPWAASSLLRMMMLGGYEEAELVASRVGSSKMGFFTQDQESTGVTPEQLAGTTETGDEGKLITTAEPGSYQLLPKGVGFETFDPQHPSTAFGDFVKSCLRGIASGLGVNYNSLANDLEGVNYTSLRHGELDVRAVWMPLQEWVIETFCVPIYRDWLSTSLLAGVLTVNNKPLKADREEKYQKVTWQPKRWEWVDPYKEMSSNQLAFAHRVISPQKVIRDRGDDPETVLDEWQEWEKMLAERKLSSDSAPELDQNLLNDGGNNAGNKTNNQN